MASALATPSAVRLGPMPRAMIPSVPALLPRMNPAITMSLPVLTKALVLMLASLAATDWLKSYASIKPTPEVLLLPRTMAV